MISRAMKFVKAIVWLLLPAVFCNKREDSKSLHFRFKNLSDTISHDKLILQDSYLFGFIVYVMNMSAFSHSILTHYSLQLGRNAVLVKYLQLYESTEI